MQNGRHIAQNAGHTTENDGCRVVKKLQYFKKFFQYFDAKR